MSTACPSAPSSPTGTTHSRSSLSMRWQRTARTTHTSTGGRLATLGGGAGWTGGAWSVDDGAASGPRMMSRNAVAANSRSGSHASCSVRSKAVSGIARKRFGTRIWGSHAPATRPAHPPRRRPPGGQAGGGPACGTPCAERPTGEVKARREETHQPARQSLCLHATRAMPPPGRRDVLHGSGAVLGHSRQPQESAALPPLGALCFSGRGARTCSSTTTYLYRKDEEPWTVTSAWWGGDVRVSPTPAAAICSPPLPRVSRPCLAAAAHTCQTRTSPTWKHCIQLPRAGSQAPRRSSSPPSTRFSPHRVGKGTRKRRVTLCWAAPPATAPSSGSGDASAGVAAMAAGYWRAADSPSDCTVAVGAGHTPQGLERLSAASQQRVAEGGAMTMHANVAIDLPPHASCLTPACYAADGRRVSAPR